MWPQTWHKYGRQSRSWMWAINNKSRKSFTSHATQLVIHLTARLKSHSICTRLHTASFRITAKCRQTHDWSWMQVINIILTNYTMQRESKQTTLIANFIWDNGNLLVSPPFWAVRTQLPPYVSSAPLLKQYTKDFVWRPLMTKGINFESQPCLKGSCKLPTLWDIQCNRLGWPPLLSTHKC